MKKLTKKLELIIDKVFKEASSVYKDVKKEIGTLYTDTKSFVTDTAGAIAGAVMEVYARWKPRIVIGLYTVGILEAALLFWMVVSFLVGWPVLGTLIGAFAAILALLLWLAPKFLLGLIDSTINKLPYVKEVTEALTEALRKAIKPFLDSALIIGFVSLFGTIYGMNGYGMPLLIIAFGATIFFIIYALTKKSFSFPWRGIMATIIVVGLFYRGASMIAPRPMAEFDYWVGDLIDNSASGEERTILAGTYLYDANYFVIDTAKTDIVVMVVGIHKEKRIGEKLYEVIMPVADGQYLGGKTRYVPKRSTVRGNDVKMVSNHNTDITPVKEQTKQKRKEVVVKFRANSEQKLTGITIEGKPGEALEFIPIEGICEIAGSTGWTEVDVQQTLPVVNPGGFTIKGKTNGSIKIVQWY